MAEEKRNTRLSMFEVLMDIFRDEDFSDTTMEETAKRVTNFLFEFDGSSPEPELKMFKAVSSQMVVVKDIEFSSICAHHLLPFQGVVHVGYVVGDHQIGLSKIPRLVRWYAKRPQVQEALGYQIASRLKKELRPMGVIVVINAKHTCMSCRGIMAHNSSMVTSVPNGIFLSNPHAKQEFLELIK